MQSEANHTINELRDKLHMLIEQRAEYEEIYQASIALDALIEQVLEYNIEKQEV